MQLIHGDCSESLIKIKNGSIDLVILDPPYFRVVQCEWDRFTNRDVYKKFAVQYLTAVIESLRLNGTIVLFGCAVNVNIMALLNNILEDNGMEFIQEIVIDKGMKSIAGRISDKIKMLPPVSESIWIYRKDAKPFIKELLITKQKEAKMTNKEIKEVLSLSTTGGGNWTKYTGNTQFPLFPTKEIWNKLKSLFSINIEYSTIKETFNSIVGLTNVWSDLDFYMKPRLHPTQKPTKLMERLLYIFSDENNIILDPFMGSGSTGIACINTNRNFIGIEKDDKYFEIAKKRIEDHQRSLKYKLI